MKNPIFEITTDGSYKAANSLTISPFSGIPISAAHIAPNFCSSPTVTIVYRDDKKVALANKELITSAFSGVSAVITTEKWSEDTFVNSGFLKNSWRALFKRGTAKVISLVLLPGDNKKTFFY